MILCMGGLVFSAHLVEAADIVIKINKRYLNLPVAQTQARGNMKL